jgi:iron complex transport system substrate-binding protein
MPISMPLPLLVRRRFILGLIVMLVASVGLDAASAQSIEVPHAQGATLVAVRPEKVLTFDLAALDTLDALGVSVSGVPKTGLPAYLSKFAEGASETIGTLFEPDYEAVNAASPDLIIVGERSRAKYRDLARIAPTIDLSINQKDFLKSTIGNVRLLARIFGKESEADAHIAELEKSVADARLIGMRSGTALIVLTTGGKMSAYGPGSRFGLIHDALGIKPAVEGLDVTTHGQAVSAEFILKVNPDWLFVIDRDVVAGSGGAAPNVLDNELVAQTTAWEKGQVVYLDAVNWYLVGGGLTALRANVEQVAKALAGR